MFFFTPRVCPIFDANATWVVSIFRPQGVLTTDDFVKNVCWGHTYTHQIIYIHISCFSCHRDGTLATRTCRLPRGSTKLTVQLKDQIRMALHVLLMAIMKLRLRRQTRVTWN